VRGGGGGVNYILTFFTRFKVLNFFEMMNYDA